DAATPMTAGQHHTDEVGPSIIGELRAGQVVRIDDALADPRTSDESHASAFIQNGDRAAVLVPLIKDGRLSATLYAYQREPRHWHDEELTLIEEATERTWEAVGRARAETALRESEDRFRQFAAYIHAVIWIYDFDTGRFEYLNPFYEEIWGEPPELAMSGVDHWTR